MEEAGLKKSVSYMILLISKGQTKVEKKKIRTAAASGQKVTDGESEAGECFASWKVWAFHVHINLSVSCH